MAELIYYNGAAYDIEEEEEKLARMLYQESRMARAYNGLLDAYREFKKIPQRRPVDADFLGWIAWNNGEGVPRDKQLIIRFGNGEVSAPRTYEETNGWGVTNWGEHIDEIVAYRLA